MKLTWYNLPALNDYISRKYLDTYWSVNFKLSCLCLEYNSDEAATWIICSFIKTKHRISIYLVKNNNSRLLIITIMKREYKERNYNHHYDVLKVSYSIFYVAGYKTRYLQKRIICTDVEMIWVIAWYKYFPFIFSHVCLDMIT